MHHTLNLQFFYCSPVVVLCVYCGPCMCSYQIFSRPRAYLSKHFCDTSTRIRTQVIQVHISSEWREQLLCRLQRPSSGNPSLSWWQWPLLLRLRTRLKTQVRIFLKYFWIILIIIIISCSISSIACLSLKI